MYMKGRFTQKLKWELCRLLFPSFVKKYQLAEHISTGRLRYLRHLIDLYYLHESRNEIFCRKFRESITLKELKKSHIVNFTYSPKQIAEYIISLDALSGNMNVSYNPAEIDMHDLIRNISERLSPEEMEVISLLADGFTLQELNVILGMKHNQSISVKIHRIRKKCLGKHYR